ncbi:UDP-glucose 6-dehydrogenase [Candidatus Acidianus copahuensis]|uniref:UDP-glucose 6-dehydrogenase n=1 Tax=Candidatus Acidianus copahuensis TaxID=1160895 RepID=A0A031LKY8_9CREN|nr:nucleotide sugar dehydrogenase [Candidatus Acidianus copahuensis]EZQ01563.1 UDP-glucose 6-dehydrogenase [Candidatus Acidianus copahuensis]
MEGGVPVHGLPYSSVLDLLALKQGVAIIKVPAFYASIPCPYDSGKMVKVKINYTTDYSKLSDVDIAFITVSTPTVNGKILLDHVFSAVSSLSNVLRRDAIIVMKSTVIPDTSRKAKELSGMEVVVNPEFLREGYAIEDTLHPDRIVIGGDKSAGDLVEEVWRFTNSPIIRTSLEEAELIKYASNSFLAVKISFANEIANLCERIPNCDVNVVTQAMGIDKRISPYFLKAGLGYGGSCFPKDTLAILGFSSELGEKLRIVEAAVEVNNERPLRAISAMKELMGEIKGKRICILGLSFKPGTDDTRESVALKILNLLEKEGAEVIAYDPKAKVEGIKIARNSEECIMSSEGVIIATEWSEFSGIEPILKGKYVFDGRRVLDLKKLDNAIMVGVSRCKG